MYVREKREEATRTSNVAREPNNVQRKHMYQYCAVSECVAIRSAWPILKTTRTGSQLDQRRCPANTAADHLRARRRVPPDPAEPQNRWRASGSQPRGLSTTRLPSPAREPVHRASAASRRVPLILAIEKSMQPIFKFGAHGHNPHAPVFVCS